MDDDMETAWTNEDRRVCGSSEDHQTVKAEEKSKVMGETQNEENSLMFPAWFKESAFYQLWCRIGDTQMLQSDLEIACFLLKCYDESTEKSAERICVQCSSPLQLVCLFCHINQNQRTGMGGERQVSGAVPCRLIQSSDKVQDRDTQGPARPAPQTQDWNTHQSVRPATHPQEKHLHVSGSGDDRLPCQEFHAAGEEGTRSHSGPLSSTPLPRLKRSRHLREPARKPDGSLEGKEESHSETVLKVAEVHPEKEGIPKEHADTDIQSSLIPSTHEHAPHLRQSGKKKRGRLSKYGIMSLACSKCGQTLSSTQSLISHLFTQHGVCVSGSENLHVNKRLANLKNKQSDPSRLELDPQVSSLLRRRGRPRKSESTHFTGCSSAEANKKCKSSAHEYSVKNVERDFNDFKTKHVDNANDGGNVSNTHLDVKREVKKKDKERKRKDVTEGRLCEVCGASFTDCKQLYIHRQNCKSTRCHLCGREVKRIKTHMMRHLEHKRFQCPQCPKSFPFRTNLQQHMIYHNDERPHVCEVCGMRYREKARLNDHLRTHSGLKPFKCSVCDATFTRSRGLRDHQRVHTGEKPYRCDMCGRPFSSTGNLAAHRRKVHKMAPLPCNHGASKNTLWSRMQARLEEDQNQKDSDCVQEVSGISPGVFTPLAPFTCSDAPVEEKKSCGLTGDVLLNTTHENVADTDSYQKGDGTSAPAENPGELIYGVLGDPANFPVVRDGQMHGTGESNAALGILKGQEELSGSFLTKVGQSGESGDNPLQSETHLATSFTITESEAFTNFADFLPTVTH